MKVETRNIAFSFDDKPIISEIDLRAESGEFVGIVGPNGSGKSTLLKTIFGLYTPDRGTIRLAGRPISQFSSKEMAKTLAVLHQETSTNFEFSVKEIVLMGRAPHKKLLESDTETDERIAQNVLVKVGMLPYQDRSITTLSGGEKQRVLLARALAQQAEVLILDEPTNHLDIHYQLQLMDLIKSLNTTVIAALHDLNMAAEYCDKIYVLNRGQIKIAGSPEEVFTPEILNEVFQVNADIIRHPQTQKLHITYLPWPHPEN